MAGPRIDRSLLLQDSSVPTCSLNTEVPWPVDERLDRLVGLIAGDQLGPSSKRELAAALIQTAPESGLELWDRVLRFRRSTVGESAFWVPSDETMIAFSERKSGPRPR